MGEGAAPFPFSFVDRGWSFGINNPTLVPSVVATPLMVKCGTEHVHLLSNFILYFLRTAQPIACLGHAVRCSWPEEQALEPGRHPCRARSPRPEEHPAFSPYHQPSAPGIACRSQTQCTACYRPCR